MKYYETPSRLKRLSKRFVVSFGKGAFGPLLFMVNSSDNQIRANFINKKPSCCFLKRNEKMERVLSGLKCTNTFQKELK